MAAAATAAVAMIGRSLGPNQLVVWEPGGAATIYVIGWAMTVVKVEPRETDVITRDWLGHRGVVRKTVPWYHRKMLPWVRAVQQISKPEEAASFLAQFGLA
jgi:hypothetical protein